MGFWGRFDPTTKRGLANLATGGMYELNDLTGGLGNPVAGQVGDQVQKYGGAGEGQEALPYEEEMRREAERMRYYSDQAVRNLGGVTPEMRAAEAIRGAGSSVFGGATGSQTRAPAQPAAPTVPYGQAAARASEAFGNRDWGAPAREAAERFQKNTYDQKIADDYANQAGRHIDEGMFDAARKVAGSYSSRGLASSGMAAGAQGDLMLDAAGEKADARFEGIDKARGIERQNTLDVLGAQSLENDQIRRAIQDVFSAGVAEEGALRQQQFDILAAAASASGNYQALANLKAAWENGQNAAEAAEMAGLGTLLGTGIGYYFGGVPGAQVGANVGGMVGGSTGGK